MLVILDSDNGSPTAVRGNRRRSVRVALDLGPPVQLEGAGSAWLMNVGLGGATLETERRLEAGAQDRLLIQYREAQAELEIQAYRSMIHELFYAEDGASRVRYRTRVVFRNCSVEAFRTLYRIIRDYRSPVDAMGGLTA